MNAFPGSFLLGIIVTGLNVMPSTISDFRKSSLLKRISVTPVSSKRVLLSICGFYLIIMVISVIFVVACTVLIFAKN
jgi:ABC-type multidrug transport system permease subunit